MTTAAQSFTLGAATVGGDFQLGGPDSITLDGLTVPTTFGTDTFVRTLPVTGIDARPTFGTPTLGQTISPSGIDARPTFGTPALQPGTATISPAGLDARPQFGTPSGLTSGPFVLGESMLGALDVLGGTSNDLAVAGFSAPVTFGAFHVTPVDVYAVGIDARPSFGTPTLATGVVVPGISAPVTFGRVDVYAIASSTFGAGTFGDGFYGGAASLDALPVAAAPFTIGESAVGGGDALGGNGVGTQRIFADRIWPPSPQFGTVRVAHVLTVAGIDARPQFGTPSWGVAIFGVAGIDARPTFGPVQLVGTARPPGIDARATFGTPTLRPILAVRSIPVIVHWGVFSIQGDTIAGPFSASIDARTAAGLLDAATTSGTLDRARPAAGTVTARGAVGTLAGVTATGSVE